jgi:hypothetical protein
LPEFCNPFFQSKTLQQLSLYNLQHISHASAVSQGNVIWAMDAFSGRGHSFFTFSTIYYIHETSRRIKFTPIVPHLQYGEVAALMFYFLFLFSFLTSTTQVEWVSGF